MYSLGGVHAHLSFPVCSEQLMVLIHIVNWGCHILIFLLSLLNFLFCSPELPRVLKAVDRAAAAASQFLFTEHRVSGQVNSCDAPEAGMGAKDSGA